MSARTQALLVDFSIAAVALALGVFAGGVTVSSGTPVFVLVGTAVIVSLLYLSEHRPLITLVDECRPHSLLLVVLVTTVVAGILVGGHALGVDPAGALLVGFGLGVAGYRFRYGVLEPLPRQRLQQARLLRGEDWNPLEREQP